MKLNFGKIYKITNNVNGKVYIGQTIRTLKARFNQHIHRTGCTYLHSALQKYGKENFSIQLIEEVPKELLDEREIYWISFYDSTNKSKGYNLIKGGRLGAKDKFKLTPEQIRTLIELENQGVTHIELGKKFKINRKTVTFIIKREQLYFNKRVPIFERQDINDIIEFMLNSNPTTKEVVTKFGLSRTSVQRIAEKINYKFLSKSERSKLRI